VHTAKGSIATSVVICAAGAWSARVGAMAGVELDVRPVRRQIAFTEPRPGAHPRVPFTIDLETSFYFHNADDALLLGYSDPDTETGFDRSYTGAWIPELRRRAQRCAPALSDLPIASGWAGLYEQTPDANALIGEAATVSRFLYATGFSGHGFSQAPAAAEVIRDLVRGRKPFVDIRPLRAERFAEHAPIAEATIV
jgi:sarcosine oxidase subunit beta